MRHDDSSRWAVHRFARHWQCPCGAKLTVRSATERDDGPSNFRLHTDPSQTTFGHATVPHGRLNWAGLAEERGWLTGADGRLRCTACALGYPTLSEWRRVRLFAPQRAGLELLLAQLRRQLDAETTDAQRAGIVRVHGGGG